MAPNAAVEKDSGVREGMRADCKIVAAKDEHSKSRTIMTPIEELNHGLKS
jgi:hypothetical protein